MKTIEIGSLTVGNDAPLTVISGPLKEICAEVRFALS